MNYENFFTDAYFGFFDKKIFNRFQDIQPDEITDNIEFIAGQSIAISGYVDNGSGLVRVTTGAHTLNTGDIITITGTTNYTGVWVVTVIDSTHVDLQASTWTAAGADVTGTMRSGDHFKILDGGNGSYQVSFIADCTKGVGASALTEYRLYKNTILRHKIKRQLTSTDTGAFPLLGSIDVVVGDKLWVGIVNITNTNTLTIGEGTFFMHKI